MYYKIYSFLLELKIKIKVMTEDDFIKMLSELDYEQKVYAIYFRYC